MKSLSNLSFVLMSFLLLSCGSNSPHHTISSNGWQKIVINYTHFDEQTATGGSQSQYQLVLTDNMELADIKSTYGNPDYSYMYNSVDSKIGNVEIHLDNDEIWVFEFTSNFRAVLHPYNSFEPSYDVNFGSYAFAHKLRDYLQDQTANNESQFYIEEERRRSGSIDSGMGVDFEKDHPD